MKLCLPLLRARYAPVIFLLLISSLASAQWAQKADGLIQRSELGETIVYNSKFYTFTGFSDASYKIESTSERYDPATDTWAYIATMPANAAMTHQDIILIDNTIWLIGGRVGKNPGPVSSLIWIYNITTNTWSAGPVIHDPATGNPLAIAASASALLGRTLHIFGGFTTTACNNDQDKYHLTLDVDSWLANTSLPAQWKNNLKPLPQKRNHLSGLTLAGKIYAIGGQAGHDCGGGLTESPYCHVYDPSKDSWAQLPSLPAGRSHAEGSTFALDGKIYLVAGQQGNNKACKLVTIFDPAANNGTGAWADAPALALPFIYEGCSATVIDNAFIISHGSQGSSKYGLKLTYSIPIARNPVYKLGFPSGCLQVSDVAGNTIKANTWLYTINGTKEYSISSNATWLTVSKNATGIANPNAVDIEVTANTSGLSPGSYSATITANGTGSGQNYSAATLCVNLTVEGTPETYSLQVTSNGGGQVSKNPDKVSYLNGNNVILTATPNQGQQFTGWSGDVSSTTNPLTITMNADKSIVATFTPVPQYTLTLSSNGNGTINKTPNQSVFNNGAAVVLTAIPAAGHEFTGWGGDATGSTNPLTVTMSGNKAVTANFVQAPFGISNITAASGRSYVAARLLVNATVYTDRAYSVTSVPGNLNNALFIKTPNADKSTTSGSMFSFTVNDAATIYVAYDPRATVLPAWLSNWQKLTGQTIGVNDPYMNFMQLYSKDFAAGSVTLGGNRQSPANGALNNYFAIVVPTVKYTVDISLSGNGLVTKNPDQLSYNSGSTVLLTATPSAGHQFLGWSGDASGTVSPLSITMNGDKAITATFDVAGEYALTLSAIGAGNVDKSPDQAIYTGGSTVTLTAVPAAGQQFTGWSGDASGTVNPLVVAMTADKSITATFIPIQQYSLIVSSNGDGSINANPNHATYNSGSAVTLTATPAAGQQFAGWSGDATGSTNPLTVTMSSNKTITANFIEASFTISTITAASGRSYITGQLVVNTTVYTDRTYQATTVPAELNNAPFIKTPNSDKSTTSGSMFSFTISNSATVYVAYDPRGKVIPAWLSSWQKLTGQTIGVNDPYVSFMQLYSKNFSAGPVTLGGNLQSPASGALNNYFVIVVPTATNNLGITMNTNGFFNKNPSYLSYIERSGVIETPGAGR